MGDIGKYIMIGTIVLAVLILLTAVIKIRNKFVTLLNRVKNQMA